MNDLTIFDFKGNDVRILKKDNEIYWVAKDVCEVLELSDVSMSVKRLDEDEKLIYTLQCDGKFRQNRETWIINESGLYSLILKSNKPQAKEFKKWVMSVGLPTIRKIGYLNNINIDFWSYEQRDKSGFVYIIYDKLSALYKIGFTQRDIIDRLKDFKTANINLTAIGSFYSSNARALERNIHQYLKDYWVSGEWFVLEKDKLNDVVRKFRINLYLSKEEL